MRSIGNESGCFAMETTIEIEAEDIRARIAPDLFTLLHLF